MSTKKLWRLKDYLLVKHFCNFCFLQGQFFFSLFCNFNYTVFEGKWADLCVSWQLVKALFEINERQLISLTDRPMKDHEVDYKVIILDIYRRILSLTCPSLQVASLEKTNESLLWPLHERKDKRASSAVIEHEWTCSGALKCSLPLMSSLGVLAVKNKSESVS